MTRYPSRWLDVVLVALVIIVGGATLGASGRAVTNKDITVRLRAGKFAEAEKLARERLAVGEHESGAESVAAADVLDLLSEAMRQGGKGGQAEVGEICKRAVRIKERKLGKDHPGYGASVYQLGSWYYMNGQYETAKPLLEGSLRVRETALGPNHLDTSASLLMLGALQTELGNHPGAKTLVEQALSIREAQDPNGRFRL